MPTLTFIATQPFLLQRDACHRHRYSITHRVRAPIIVACQAEVKPPKRAQSQSKSPIQNGDVESEPSKSVDVSTEERSPRGMLFDPQVAPSLLQKPESVLTVVTLGFLSTIAFLAKSASRITAGVATRTNNLIVNRTLHARVRTRNRERTFLQSAVDATQATLENTSSYLEVQQKRATSAEQRLDRLEAQQTALQEAQQERSQLNQQLAEAESKLSLQTQLAESEQQNILDLRATVQRYHEQVTTFDAHLQRTTLRITEARKAEVLELQAAREKATYLEAELNEKRRLVDDAMDANEQVRSQYQDSERHVEKLNMSVKDRLSEVEQHRRAIDEMTQRAEAVKLDVKRKRDAGLPLDSERVPSEQMENIIADMSSQHESAKQSLSELDERQLRMARERTLLKEQLFKKEESVRKLRKKLTQQVRSKKESSATKTTSKVTQQVRSKKESSASKMTSKAKQQVRSKKESSATKATPKVTSSTKDSSLSDDGTAVKKTRVQKNSPKKKKGSTTTKSTKGRSIEK